MKFGQKCEMSEGGPREKVRYTKKKKKKKKQKENRKSLLPGVCRWMKTALRGR
jgi:hypothetical protein